MEHLLIRTAGGRVMLWVLGMIAVAERIRMTTTYFYCDAALAVMSQEKHGKVGSLVYKRARRKTD
ncbi:hypothetical protein PL8927_760282 [Planktothrix serta PCC 8927]|uniref:Uncharacterized protein n=1 Tax=Planktothrix serta PCC 8927 TaxID=671068 RepID=A0A7Z9BX07_9CYAN|nr:hypothetical protein PL8927_760282 [Planktothrix serta PCC 8927]